MSDAVDSIDELFNPVPEPIKTIFPGAKVLPLEELPDKLFE